MVLTVKFSQFTSTTPQTITTSNQVVGLDSGVNVQANRYFTWTTSTRPLSPFNGLFGLNTTLEKYEYWDSVSSTWNQFTDDTDIAALLAQLAAHTSGNGASLIGLLNQSNVTGKTVQDFANAPFVAQTNTGVLQNAQYLSALSTGILKSTTSTGVLSISTPITQIDNLSPVQGDMLYYNGSSWVLLAPGTAGFILQTQGAAANPQWVEDFGVGTVTSLSEATGITLTPNPITMTGTIGLTIPVAVTSGGTGLISTTVNQILYSSSNNVIAGLATGNNGVLITSSGGVPSISSTLPAAVQSNITVVGTIGTGVWQGTPPGLAYGGTNNSLTASAGGIVWSDATKLNILAGTSTAGLPLLSGNAATPTWGAYVISLGGALTTGGAVTFSGAYTFTGTLTGNTSVTFPTSGTLATTSQLGISTLDGDSGSATGSTVTISGGSTGLTTSGSSATITLTGTLATGNGGTGVTSVTISPTASAFAGWDANKNFSAVNFIPGYQTIASAATTTTLTVASPYSTFITGTTTQTVQMPVAATLVLGQVYQIVNNSTGNVTVQSSGGNTIVTMTTNTVAYLTCILASGTTAASWYYEFVNKVESTGTVTSVSTGTGLTGGPITTTGTISLASIADANLLANTSGGSAAPVATTLTALIDYAFGSTQGNILYRNSTTWTVLTPGTSGQFLKTGGASANPSWATSTSKSFSINVQIFTAGTSTYTPTSGLVEATVEICGSGGSGGGCANAANAGAASSGSGAGYSKKTYSAALIGANATVVVGATVNGGAAGSNDGSAGNTSTFTPAGAGAVLTATGGGAGKGGVNGSGVQFTASPPGAPGTGTNGDINIAGGFGSTGQGLLTSATLPLSGGSFWSPPQFTNPNVGTGTNGTGFGGGGSGAVSIGSSGAAAGGNGAPAQCIVTEYIYA